MKRVGILGLPQSGKTTLFEVLMRGAGITASGSQGRDSVGVVTVPDPRVDQLSALYRPKKTVYAQIQFVDSAAAGQGSARAAARGPDLFSGVRECDALVAVCRDFEESAVPTAGGVDPMRDLSKLETELIVNDLAIVEARIEKIAKELRVGKKEGAREHAVLSRCLQALESGRPLRGESFDPEERKLIKGFQLLTLKPLLVVYNQGEHSTGTPGDLGPRALAMVLRAHLEREIVALPAEERPAFRAELGAEEDGLTLVIQACYRLLDLVSFFTVGDDEVRAWTVGQGDRAVDAAGEIHTDMAKGFIRAEVIGWDKLLDAGSEARARERGWMRLEGREYIVQDGDCVEIRFNK